MSDFDEKSEVAACKTEWGRWYQTMDEVYVEVHLEEGTSGKQVKVNIMPKKLLVTVKGEKVIEVKNILFFSWNLITLHIFTEIKFEKCVYKVMRMIQIRKQYAEL